MPIEQRKQALGQPRTPRPSRRRAVTLVEVLLVLVVLTLITAIAWPLLERSFAKQRLRDAADLIRAEWNGAQAEAMRSGVAQQFHYTIEEQTYWVQPCEDATGSSGVNVPADVGSGYDQSVLPDEIYFHEGEVQRGNSEGASAEQASQAGEIGPGMIEDGEPGAAIVFHPNGTCSSARLVLRNEYGRGITVTIRGLTGMSDVSEFFSIEEQL